MVISEKQIWYLIAYLEKLAEVGTDELEKLYQFLYGAHSASSFETASATFHLASHKLQDIINEIKNDHQ